MARREDPLDVNLSASSCGSRPSSFLGGWLVVFAAVASICASCGDADGPTAPPDRGRGEIAGRSVEGHGHVVSTHTSDHDEFDCVECLYNERLSAGAPSLREALRAYDETPDDRAADGALAQHVAFHAVGVARGLEHGTLTVGSTSKRMVMEVLGTAARKGRILLSTRIVELGLDDTRARVRSVIYEAALDERIEPSAVAQVRQRADHESDASAKLLAEAVLLAGASPSEDGRFPSLKGALCTPKMLDALFLMYRARGVTGIEEIVRCAFEDAGEIWPTLGAGAHDRLPGQRLSVRGLAVLCVCRAGPQAIEAALALCVNGWATPLLKIAKSWATAGGGTPSVHGGVRDWGFTEGGVGTLDVELAIQAAGEGLGRVLDLPDARWLVRGMSKVDVLQKLRIVEVWKKRATELSPLLGLIVADQTLSSAEREGALWMLKRFGRTGQEELQQVRGVMGGDPLLEDQDEASADLHR